MKHRPMVVVPYSRPYTHIVRFKNNRANLLRTFTGMAKGQDILIRMPLRTDRAKVQGTANSARVRIKIEEHPAFDMVRVTSLGPQRERVMSETTPGRVRYFKTRRFVPPRPQVSSLSPKQKSKRKPKLGPQPGPQLRPQSSGVSDIFS